MIFIYLFFLNIFHNHCLNISFINHYTHSFIIHFNVSSLNIDISFYNYFDNLIKNVLKMNLENTVISFHFCKSNLEESLSINCTDQLTLNDLFYSYFRIMNLVNLNNNIFMYKNIIALYVKCLYSQAYLFRNTSVKYYHFQSQN